jgi:hypothetical protein
MLRKPIDGSGIVDQKSWPERSETFSSRVNFASISDISMGKTYQRI